MGVYKKVKGDGDRNIPHQVIKELLTVRVVKLKCNDKYYLVRTELNGKAYLGFRQQE